MENKSTDPKVILENSEGVTICVHHKWNRLREDELSTLISYTIVCSAVNEHGIYQIMRDVNPLNFLQRAVSDFKLVKYVPDVETGKVLAYAVDISQDEATAIINIRH